VLPLTSYARTADGLHIAYQIFGSGETRLVFAPRFVSTIGYMWEIPAFARFLDRLGEIATVIALDVRGAGLSDRVVPDTRFALEARVLDVRAAMDAEGWDRASMLGSEDGGSLCALFAATDPDRVDRLILHTTYARASWSEDYPWGWTDETWESYLADIDSGWGDPKWMIDQARWIVPSRSTDEEFLRRVVTMYHLGANYETVRNALDVERHLDIRDVLPSIQAPTLVLYEAENQLEPPAQGRYVADHVPDGRFVELPGGDFEIFGDGADRILEEIEMFLTGTRPAAASTRVLAAVLFTDIVGSTERAASMGDHAWTELLGAHMEQARRLLLRYGGELVDTAGDGLLATFDGPARAVRCAREMSVASPSTGVEIRAGVHVGEIERVPDGIAGIALHIGARIAARATANEILVSSTVKDLVAGSGLVFDDAGEHELKGVPDRWHLYRVLQEDA